MSWEESVTKLKQGFERATTNGRPSTSAATFPLLTPKQMKTFANTYDWEKTPDREASVLVLLCSIEGSPSILFTRRAAHLTLHASEISFPGGHHQPGEDASLRHTALREAAEELLPVPATLLEDHVTVLGQASRIPSLKGTPVTPVIACLTDLDLPLPLAQTFPGDPAEVDLVFGVGLEELLRCETAERLPANRFGMAVAPVFPTVHGKIWGLTALILRPLLHRWIGRSLLLTSRHKDSTTAL